MGTMEHEECRGRADNSPAAAPLQPSLLTPAPPGLPMEGQRTAGKGPEGDGTHFLKPEGPEEGAHPPHPYEAPTTIRTQEEEERFPDGLPFGKRVASRGTPEGQPAARHRVETAGVPRVAEETHQGGAARADNTRSSRRKRRDSTSATEVMPPKQTEQKPPEKVGCSSDPKG